MIIPSEQDLIHKKPSSPKKKKKKAIVHEIRKRCVADVMADFDSRLYTMVCADAMPFGIFFFLLILPSP